MKLREYVLFTLIIVAVLIFSSAAISSVDVEDSQAFDAEGQELLTDFGIDSDNIFLFSWSFSGGQGYDYRSNGLPPLYSMMD